MPANYGRRPDVDYRIPPIAEPGEYRQAYAQPLINSSRLDASLNILRKLPCEGPHSPLEPRTPSERTVGRTSRHRRRDQRSHASRATCADHARISAWLHASRSPHSRARIFAGHCSHSRLSACAHSFNAATSIASPGHPLHVVQGCHIDTVIAEDGLTRSVHGIGGSS